MVVIIKKTAKKREIKRVLKSIKATKSPKKFKASEFCGKVKYGEDGLAFQKRLRNEWK